MRTLAVTRLFAILGFVGGGLAAFWLKEPGAGYMLIGAAAAAFPSGIHLKHDEKVRLGIPDGAPKREE